jgi:Flp pilus assembly protein TadG
MISMTDRAHRPGRDDGYSVLEAAIVLPVVFFLLMLIVQWAIVWHARSVAEAAAQEGLRTTEAYQSTAAAGKADTLNYLAQVAPHALPDPQVTVTRTAATATVQVHVPVMTVIPFSHFTVSETASGPVETFVDAP